MRFRQPHNYLELLSLLGRPRPFPPAGSWSDPWPSPWRRGATDLRHTVRLVRDGIREYDERLRALETQFADLNEDADRCDPIPELHDRHDDRSRGHEDRLADRLLRLSELQIHHLFNELAVRRCRLNGRGYPFTCDVDSERRRLYPDCESITQDDVEAAWDDWSNDSGKRLFVDVQAFSSREGERDLDEEVLIALDQTQFEHLFRRLCGDRAERCPGQDEFLSEQTRCFPRARAATEIEIESAFAVWIEKSNRRSGERRESTTIVIDAAEQVEEISKEKNREPVRRGRRPSREQVFRAFDEILLAFGREGSSEENGPSLRAVDEWLRQHRHPPCGDEAALRAHWLEYIVLAAKTRRTKAAERPRTKSNGRGKTTHRRSTAGKPSHLHLNGDARAIVVDDTEPVRNAVRERERK